MSQFVVNESRTPKGEGFEQQAPDVLRQLRRALTELMAAIPSRLGQIRRATDLQRALGIDNTLAWRVFKVAHAPDPLVESSRMPGLVAMKRFFEAASACGVPAKHIEASAAAIQEFDELVKVHAGDRAAFDSMISGLTEEGSEQVDAQQKRAAFRAYSHLWGIQARTQLKCSILSPSSSSSTSLDVVQLQGYVNLRRFRQAVPLLISGIELTDDDEHNILPPYRREPLVGNGAAAQGSTLLTEFCSQPLPEIRTRRSEAGDVQMELVSCGVGNESAVTYMVGDVARSLPGPYSDGTSPDLKGHAWIRIPTEVLIHDSLIHHELFGSLTPKTFVYGNHDRPPGASAFDLSQANLLGVKESTVYIGKGPSVLQTLDVPRYAEMAQYAFDRLGWDGEKYDVYRCRVEYPVMPSSVVVRFDLSEKP